MQNDGNFVVYQGVPGPDWRNPGVRAIWNSATQWVSQQVTSGSQLTTNEWIVNNSAIISADGRYAACLQNDANLVLCLAENGIADLSRRYWSVFEFPGSGQMRNQPSGPPYFAIMQGDGNFVLYDGRDPAHSGPPYWATNTSRAQGQFTAVIQPDGNFVVHQGVPSPDWRNPGVPAIWASYTVTGQGTAVSIASGDNQGVYCQQLGTSDYWYADFAPLTVTVTDSVLNPVSGREVDWTIAAGKNIGSAYNITANGQGIAPGDTANLDNVGFHWASTSDANGVASLTVEMYNIPMPGPAEGEGVGFSITATSGGASVTFHNLMVVGVT
jgi:hypothetical protein